jgi:hypothetical protein
MLLMRTQGMPLIALLTLVLACSLAYSQDREASQEASFFTDWTFDVAPFYFWIPALDGTVTVRGLFSDVDLGVGDMLDLLFENFNFAATDRAETRKGKALLTLERFSN